MLGADDDKGHFAYLLTHVVAEHGWQVLDWVLMSNHHHLLVRLCEPNLSVGMQRLHGLHAVAWNERHGKMGHAWQGRFAARGIEREEHGQRLMRYPPCNPVAAGLSEHPAEWSWSGYRAMAGFERAQPFHDAVAGLRRLEHLPDTPIADLRARYRSFVDAAVPGLVRRPGVELERPGLGEVVAPGQAASAVEAVELWGHGVAEVAARMGVHRNTVGRWRNGDLGVMVQRGQTGLHHQPPQTPQVMPPSTFSSMPVTQVASSEAR